MSFLIYTVVMLGLTGGNVALALTIGGAFNWAVGGFIVGLWSAVLIDRVIN